MSSKKSNALDGFMFGLLVGVLAMTLLIFLFSVNIHLTQETADDVCYHLTNNSASVAVSDNGKLVCELPSYDHVSTIIIRDNSEASR